MLKNKIEENVIIYAFIIFVFGAIVFGILSFANWYLICGWIYGFTIAIIGYHINVRLISIFLRLAKTKKSGFWLGFMRSFLQMVYHSVFVIILILVNTVWKQGQIFELKSINDLVNPLNIFTYMGGLGVFAISSLVVNIPLLKKKKERQ